MADVRVDVELTTSMKGIQTELAKVLRPIEQLLQRISGNPTLELQLTRQGAGLVSKQIQEFATKYGLDPKEAEKLGQAFRVFASDLERYIRSVRHGDVEEAGKRLNSAMKSLNEFLQGVSVLDQKLADATQSRFRLIAKAEQVIAGKVRQGHHILSPEKLQAVIDNLDKNLDQFLSGLGKKEADAFRRQAALQLDAARKRLSEGMVLDAANTVSNLLQSLKTSGPVVDDALLKQLQNITKDIRSNITTMVSRVADEVQRLTKEYLVSSVLPKLAPGVDPNALLRAYNYMGGPRDELLNALFDRIVAGDQFSLMAAGQTAKGLQKTVARMVGHVEQVILHRLSTSEYGRDLLRLPEGPEAFANALREAYAALSRGLISASPEELRKAGEALERGLREARERFNVSAQHTKAVGLTFQSVADFLEQQFGKGVSMLEALQMYAHSNLLNEMAEGNPLAGAYRFGRQRALDARHEDYLQAFLPGLYQQYRQAALRGDPAGLTFRTRLVAALGPSFDALHGLLLNSLANFVSGIGIGVFFGSVYALAQYVQQMEQLNRQLLAYKKILEMRGEESMAQSVAELRERLLELGRTTGVVVEEVAKLFGTLARNGLGTEGLERLLVTVGKLNTVFGIPFDALRKDISETLLQHRQYFMGPNTVADVLRYGGPQADKALNVFNQLIKMSNSAAFSFDELARAVRYYLDTGKPVRDSFYEIAEAVRYGGEVAEATAKKLDEMADKTVDFGEILTHGGDYQEEVRRLQKQLGMTISSLGHDIMAGFGIGEASVFMATLQAALAGFLGLVKLIQDLANAVLNAKVIGPILQAALGVLTVTGVVGMVVGLFRLLKLFAARVVGEVTGLIASLRTANLAAATATATNLLVALRKNLITFFTTLGTVIATASTGALNLLRAGGIAALGRAAIGGLGALAAAVPGIGWVALGATAAVGAGVYLATRQAEQRRKEIERIEKSAERLFPSIGKVEQQGSVVRIFSPDNLTDSPTYELDLEKLRSKDAVDKFVAYMLGRLEGADRLVFESATNLLRSLDVNDRQSLERRRQEIAQAQMKLVQEYAKADNAKKQLIQRELTALGVIANILASVGDTYITAVERTTPVQQAQEDLRALNDLYQVKLKENATKLLTLTDEERITEQWQYALNVAKTLTAGQDALAQFINDIAESLTSQRLENAQRRLQTRLREAESMSTETDRLRAQRAAYAQYIADLQRIEAELVRNVTAAGLPKDVVTRLLGLLYVTRKDAEAQLGQVKRQTADFYRSLSDTEAQARQQLLNVMKEAFYGPTSTPSLTLKLLAAAESILNQTANDAPEKAAVTAKAVNAFLNENLALAQEYDRRVQQMLNEFDMAKRTSDPEKRAKNLAQVVRKYLAEYAKNLNRMPGLALQIADQIEGALFKDGGFLSSINSLADSARKELERVAEKQKDYGPFNNLGQVLEAVSGGVESLRKVAELTAVYRDLSGQYKTLLETVRQTQVKSVDQLIAKTKATIAEYRKLPNLSPEAQAFVSTLEAHLKNLEAYKAMLQEYYDLERYLKTASDKNSEAYRQKLQRYTALKAKIEGLRTELTQRLNTLDVSGQALEEELTDYLTALNNAVLALVEASSNTLKEVKKLLEDRRKALERRVQDYLARQRQVSKASLEAQALQDMMDELAAQEDELSRLQEALDLVRANITGDQFSAFIAALEYAAKGAKPGKEVSEEVRRIYEDVASRLDREAAKKLLETVRAGVDSLDGLLNAVQGMLDAAREEVQKAKVQVQAYAAVLQERASLADEASALGESAKAVQEVLEYADPEAVQDQVNTLRQNARDLKSKLEDFASRNPDVDVSDIEQELKAVDDAVLTYYRARVDKIQNALPKAVDGTLAFSDAEVQHILAAFGELDYLLMQAAKEQDPALRARLQELADTLVEALTNLIPDANSPLFNFLAQYLKPEVLERYTRRKLALDFERKLNELSQAELPEVLSLGDVELATSALDARLETVAQLEDTLATLAATGFFTEEWLDAQRQQLAAERRKLEDARKKLSDQEYQLKAQEDAKQLGGASTAVDQALQLAENLILRNATLEEVLKLFRETDQGLENLPLLTEEGAAQLMELRSKLHEGFAKLLAGKDAERLLREVFGETMDWLKQNEGMGSVTDPAVKARLVAAVRDRFAKLGLQVDETVAGEVLSRLLSLTQKDLEKVFEGLSEELAKVGGLDAIKLAVSSGDLDAVQNLGANVGKVAETLAAMLHVAKLLENLGKEGASKEVKSSFLRFATDLLSSSGDLASSLQELVEAGELSEFSVVSWLERLRDVLLAVGEILSSLGEQLGLSKEELDQLKALISQQTKKLDQEIRKKQAEGLSLFYRGDLTSEQFRRQLQGYRLLVGATSLTEFSDVGTLLASQLREQLFTTGLSEEAIRRQLMQRLSSVLLLDDRSLLKLVAPDASESQLDAFLSTDVAKERLEAIRASIKRALNDLKRETEKELEQMLDSLVDSFRNALANLFSAVFSIPVQMLRAWREQQKQLEQMRFELRLAASDVEYWQSKYDEAVKTYGVLSEEARRYAEKVAEAKRAHEEWQQRIKQTEESARSLFEYLLDAIQQFLEALAQAITQQFAMRAATMLVDWVVGSVAGSGSVTPRSTGTVQPQSAGTGQGATLQTQSVPNSNPVSGIISVGSTVATQAITQAAVSSGALSALGALAGPLAGLAVGAVVGMAAEWLADVADRAFNARYYSFVHGTKGRFDTLPEAVRLQQPVNVNVNVQAQLDRNKIAKETSDRLVREMLLKGV
ncbi:tape tail measure protein [Thermus phage phiFa]|nr:tape tail measure protein [Thermus phage phiFa]